MAYINLDKDTKVATCSYCGLGFRQHHHEGDSWGYFSDGVNQETLSAVCIASLVLNKGCCSQRKKNNKNPV